MTDTAMSNALVIPLTGEVVNLAAPDDQLMLLVDQIRDYEQQLAALRARVGDELRARMDRSLTWTIRAGGFKATAPSPAPKDEYNIPALRKVLDKLVVDNVITDEASTKALEADIAWKVHKHGINALRKRSPEIAAQIDACTTSVEPRNRPVKVTRDAA